MRGGWVKELGGGGDGGEVEEDGGVGGVLAATLASVF